MIEEEQIRLMPVTSVRASLEYSNQDIDGAISFPFLAKPTLDRLGVASTALKQSTAGRRVELLIWDAYRTRETQAAIFNAYLDEVKKKSPELDPQQAREQAREFVNPPDIVYPHGTGGAVDITLLIDNRIANMGTGYNEFVPNAYADWFRINLPNNAEEVEASKNRELLRHAMEEAGFVGLGSEWWHFEYGTRTWALKTGEELILGKILPAPTVEGPADAERFVSYRQPVLESGVAQVFSNSLDRRASLAHKQPGHYYGRNSQPTLENFGKLFTSILEAKHAYFTESGLSAALVAIKSCVPPNGHILYDDLIYYEVERGLMYVAKQLSWRLSETDFTKLKEEIGDLEGVDAFFLDNPRNWWLDALDIREISQIAKAKGAKLIVDTSVQPLQNALDSGADLAVLSLSKYPSLGLTLGGAILSNDQDDIDKAKATGMEEGHVLSPEAALTIWAQSISLRDRMFALSHKTAQVAEFLKKHSKVLKVRIPDPALLDGLVGGQLSFHLVNAEQGPLMEKVIGHNHLSLRSALNLASTFGAAFTTFEHFSSNQRYRTGIAKEDTAEIMIPEDMVRIGLGCERLEDIIDDLDFVLNVTG